MGGHGSGTGTKRPDHTFGEVRRGLSYQNDKQVKHKKSLFSDKPDPSLHRAKRARDRSLGIDDSHHEEVIALQRQREEHGEQREEFVERKSKIALEARDMQDLARTYVEEAFKTLIDIMRNPDAADNAKITAITTILDRSYGKAAASMTIEQTTTVKPAQLDDDSLTKSIAETLREVKEIRTLGGGASEEAPSQNRPVNLRDYN